MTEKELTEEEAQAAREAVKSLARAGREIVTRNHEVIQQFQRAFESQMQPIREAMSQWQRAFAAQMQEIAKGLEGFAKAAKEYVRFLGIARAEGWPPPSHVPLSVIPQVLKSYEDAEPGARNRVFSEMLVKVYSVPNVLSSVEQDWKSADWLGKRQHVLLSALDAHRIEKFDLSTLALIPQVEGMIGEAFGHKGTMSIADWSSYVMRLFPSGEHTTNVEEAARDCVTVEFLAKFRWQDNIPRFSRHALSHGADVDYTAEKSVKALLLVDAVREAIERRVHGQTR